MSMRGVDATATSETRDLRAPSWRWVDVAIAFCLLASLLVVQFTLVLSDARSGDRLGLQLFGLFPTIVTAYTVIWLAHRRGMTLEGFGFNRARIVLPALLAWIVAVLAGPLVVGLGVLAAGEVTRALGALLVSPAVLIILGMVVIAPVVEEVIFRALLFRWLRQRGPFLPAALASGLIFAAFHLEAATIVPLTITGVAFAWAYNRTGSLWASIIPHAGLNALVLFALVTQQ
jgi:membrane protease YdiL (CAAX protease family)